jgi:hypothetical protein
LIMKVALLIAEPFGIGRGVIG